MLDQYTAHKYMYDFLKGRVSLLQFEQWLYEHDELEAILGEQAYMELVSRNFKDKYASEECEKQVRNLIDFGEFEQERVIAYLSKLTQPGSELLAICDMVYEEYCAGYTFLRFIALTYILEAAQAKSELISQEAARLLNFFANGQLKITTEHDYMDLRKKSDQIEIHSINDMLDNLKD
ncbi:hypothetical protein [Paenibacillus albus]|uniref:Uncharacterized protein n=1 Tax=Paenibacillus albus TaxID=2495582 RepID=A0A3Q8X5G7_9BACL|nr:hypothetical protein [Paenibacillus albus]AZN39353.1 hypothetical protein EJC50_06520 [Paenibacillus albus]